MWAGFSQRTAFSLIFLLCPQSEMISLQVRQRDNYCGDFTCSFYFPLAPLNHPGSPDLVLLFLGLSEGQEFQSFTSHHDRNKTMYANDN